MAIALSRIGSAGLVWILLAIGAALLWRRPLLALQVVLAVVTADLLALALKGITARPRPFVTHPDPAPLLRPPLDLSFPSGHAATSFAGATVLALLTRRRAALLYGLAAAIACSRVYVGVHYPSDILGGAVLGVAVGAAVVWLAQRSERRGGSATALRRRATARLRSVRVRRRG